jgi:hypothetical protein
MTVKGGRSGHKADSLTAICEPIVQKKWEPRRLTTLWASVACYKDSFTYDHSSSKNKELPQRPANTKLRLSRKLLKSFWLLFGNSWRSSNNKKLYVSSSGK